MIIKIFTEEMNTFQAILFNNLTALVKEDESI